MAEDRIHCLVTIGKGANIQEGVSIGIYPAPGKVHIGDGPTIRSGSVIYSDVIIGKGLKTGHNVLIREKTVIGDNVLVGTDTIIDGDVRIGNNVSLQSGVYVPPKTVIEDNVFIGPRVVFTNDKEMSNPQSGGSRKPLVGATVRKGARIGANSVILPGIEIGQGAVIGAGSVVTKDVPAGAVAFGNPARVRV